MPAGLVSGEDCCPGLKIVPSLCPHIAEKEASGVSLYCKDTNSTALGPYPYDPPLTIFAFVKASSLNTVIWWVELQHII